MKHMKMGWISAKIKKIMHEGIRGKKVSLNQAMAVAYSMAKKRKGRRKKSKNK